MSVSAETKHVPQKWKALRLVELYEAGHGERWRQRKYALAVWVNGTLTTHDNQRSPLLSDSFDILISIVGEQNVRDGEFLGDAVPQRHYVNSYYAAQGERERVELTNRIVNGGKRYLESRSVTSFNWFY